MSDRYSDNLIAENEALRKELAQLKRDYNVQLRCAQISNAAMKEALIQTDLSAEIESFLASIGRSLEVDRIYIFEDDPDGKGTSNTYEWCDENVTSEIGNMQNIPFEAIRWWYDQFEAGKDIHIMTGGIPRDVA